MDFRKILELLTGLKTFLKTHPDPATPPSLRIVQNTVSALLTGAPDTEKAEYVIEKYKALYTGRSGLTEYYIWDHDDNRRMELNEPLERIRDAF